MFEDVATADEVSRNIHSTLHQCAAELPLQAKHDFVMSAMQDWMQMLDQYIKVCAGVKEWAERMDRHFETHVVDSLGEYGVMPENWSDKLRDFQKMHAYLQWQSDDMAFNSMAVTEMVSFLYLISVYLLQYARAVEMYEAGYTQLTRFFGADSRPPSP